MRTCVWYSDARGFVMVKVDSRDSETSVYVTMSVGVSLCGDGGLLNVTSGLSLFRCRRIVMMAGDESLGSSGGYDTMRAGLSTGGGWLVLSVASSSGRNTGRSMLFIRCRGRSDIGERIDISLDISSTTSSG